MTEAERVYWNRVLCGIVSDHIAHHDAVKAQKKADEAKAHAERVSKAVKVAQERAYQEKLAMERTEKERLRILRHIAELNAAEEKRLQEEAQKAEFERLQQERENDPFYVKVRNYWNQSLTPQNRQFNIAA